MATAELVEKKSMLLDNKNINIRGALSVDINKLNFIIRDLKRIERAGGSANLTITPTTITPYTTTVDTIAVEHSHHTVDEDVYTEYNKDVYLDKLNIINDAYICTNSKLSIGDIVTIGDKSYGIAEQYVIANDISDECTGIYVKLANLKADGTFTKRYFRKSRLDDRGWPIEDLI